MQLAVRLEFQFKFACDLKSVNFTEFQGFYDVPGNFEFDFWATGLYVDAAYKFSSSFFEFFLRAISIKKRSNTL